MPHSIRLEIGLDCSVNKIHFSMSILNDRNFNIGLRKKNTIYMSHLRIISNTRLEFEKNQIKVVNVFETGQFDFLMLIRVFVIYVHEKVEY